MVAYLERLDTLYQNQSTVLIKILNGYDNINSYKTLLEYEKAIFEELKSEIEAIQDNVLNFKNLIREYRSFYQQFIESKTGKSFPAMITTEVFLLIIVFLGLWLCTSSFQLMEDFQYRRLGIMADLAMIGGIIIGILDAVSIGYLIKLIKDQRIIKFYIDIVKDRMI
mgnify:CR=1 FL=1